MGIEAVVGFADQFPIEALFTSARLVASDQQNCAPPRVERERHAPFAARRTEPQVLHVGVTQAFQRVHARPAEMWSKLLE